MVASNLLLDTRISDVENQEAQRRAYLCAIQCLGGGWPPQGGWPLEAIWRAALAMFVGKYISRFGCGGRQW